MSKSLLEIAKKEATTEVYSLHAIVQTSIDTIIEEVFPLDYQSQVLAIEQIKKYFSLGCLGTLEEIYIDTIKQSVDRNISAVLGRQTEFSYLDNKKNSFNHSINQELLKLFKFIEESNKEFYSFLFNKYTKEQKHPLVEISDVKDFLNLILLEIRIKYSELLNETILEINQKNQLVIEFINSNKDLDTIFEKEFNLILKSQNTNFGLLNNLSNNNPGIYKILLEQQGSILEFVKSYIRNTKDFFNNVANRKNILAEFNKLNLLIKNIDAIDKNIADEIFNNQKIVKDILFSSKIVTLNEFYKAVLFYISNDENKNQILEELKEFNKESISSAAIDLSENQKKIREFFIDKLHTADPKDHELVRSGLITVDELQQIYNMISPDELGVMHYTIINTLTIYSTQTEAVSRVLQIARNYYPLNRLQGFLELGELDHSYVSTLLHHNIVSLLEARIIKFKDVEFFVSTELNNLLISRLRLSTNPTIIEILVKSHSIQAIRKIVNDPLAQEIVNKFKFDIDVLEISINNGYIGLAKLLMEHNKFSISSLNENSYRYFFKIIEKNLGDIRYLEIIAKSAGDNQTINKFNKEILEQAIERNYNNLAKLYIGQMALTGEEFYSIKKVPITNFRPNYKVKKRLIVDSSMPFSSYKYSLVEKKVLDVKPIITDDLLLKAIKSDNIEVLKILLVKIGDNKYINLENIITTSIKDNKYEMVKILISHADNYLKYNYKAEILRKLLQLDSKITIESNESFKLLIKNLADEDINICKSYIKDLKLDNIEEHPLNNHQDYKIDILGEEENMSSFSS